MNAASKQSADFRLDGKNVVVAVGARGIGQAIAVLFASRGADSTGMRDVCDEIARSAPIEVLVNSAGIAHVGNLESTSEADFDKVFQVNVRGIFNCSKEDEMFARLSQSRPIGRMA